jgi:molybdate transport system substrate-binding protein
LKVYTIPSPVLERRTFPDYDDARFALSHKRGPARGKSLKRILNVLFLLIGLAIIAGCRQEKTTNETNHSAEITVAAAANLTDVFAEIGPKFTSQTGIKVVFSFGATAELARQIENGAPFDVFAAADSEHPEQLEMKGMLTAASRVIYARGRLVMWLPSGSDLKATHIEDITAKSFERIAIAKPDVAPYGRATVESLRALKIWDAIEPRVIYGQNVSQTKQYAATGNAEVAFIPLALVKPGEGSYLEVKDELHQPINQALGIVKESKKQTEARKFVDFLMSPEIQELLSQKGYRKPPPQ